MAADAAVAASEAAPSVIDWPTHPLLHHIHPQLRHFLLVSQSLTALHLPVAHRLHERLSVWKQLASDTYVVEVIQHGYKPIFQQQPPLTCKPGWFSVGKSQEQAMLTEIDSMREKGAIEPVSNIHSPGFYTSIFLVPKKNGKLRPVINLKPLNQYLQIPRFKMLTNRTLVKVLTKGGYAASLDLSDAYFHIPIRKSFRKYLRFAFKGKVWQFRSLPFGLSTSPYVFTRVAAQVSKFLQSFAIPLHQYLDDWLTDAITRSRTRLQMQIVLHVSSALGWLVNYNKSELDPTQNFDFVGVTYALDLYLMFPPEQRYSKAVVEVQQMLSRLTSTLKQWQTLLGLLQSMADQVPLGKLHIRPLYIEIKQQISFGDDPASMVTLNPQLSQHLTWWLDPNRIRMGAPMGLFHPQVVLTSDSSDHAWGAHLTILDDATFFRESRGGWTQEQQHRHINHKELWAVFEAMKSWQSILTGRSVKIETDNSTVVSVLNNQGTVRSSQLHQLTHDILSWAFDHRIVVRAFHLKGSLNVLADRLSRPNTVLATEWTLNKSTFLNLCQLWGNPDLDLFATRVNYRLQTFVSPMRDPQAYAVDALSLDWKDMFVYAFPPPRLLPRVMQKARETHRLKMLLVAPFWPRMPWFPSIGQGAQRDPVPLRPMDDQPLLTQKLGNGLVVSHPNPELLQLHAWIWSSQQ